MSMQWNYGNGVMVLPLAVAEHLKKADKKDLTVLLALAVDPTLLTLSDGPSRLAQTLKLSTDTVMHALSFWRGTGVLEETESDSAAPKEEQAPAKAVAQSSATSAPLHTQQKGLPSYSSKEICEVLERRKRLTGLIDACQQTLGKIFNQHEVGIIVGMADYLGMDDEWILLILCHCVRIGKTSLRYAEKMALSLYDEGVSDAAALEERLRRSEVFATMEGKLRAMFGISSRALTSKEKGMIEKWISDMQYDEAVLRRAYEITVDSIGKPSIPYANTILERWHAEGYRTVEDVDRAIEDYRHKKSESKGSFDTDDFFEAAIRRTYGE